jgi:hypothetical protein
MTQPENSLRAMKLMQDEPFLSQTPDHLKRWISTLSHYRFNKMKNPETPWVVLNLMHLRERGES